MELPLNELKEKLLDQFDELELLEHLRVSTQDIVEAFEDRIAERYDFFLQLVSDDDEEPTEDGVQE